MDILILISLVLLNGMLAMSEIALVTARRSRLAALAAEGDASSEVAIRLGAEPTQLMSTIQIGITAIGILNGIVGESALAAPLSIWLQRVGIEQQTSEISATILVVCIITYVSIVVGELVPKRIGQFNAEGIARLVARPISVLARVSRPFVHLLSYSTDGILRLLGKRDSGSANVTEDDIHAMLEEGSESGIIEKQEHDMVRNVFRLDDRQIGSLMIPRSDIVYLDIDQPLEMNLKHVAESAHSRFPVCRGGLQDILGILTAKQLFNQLHHNGVTDLTTQLQPCVYLPESMTGMELLEQFRVSGTDIMFVIDEYADVQGLVTLQDVLEAVTGEFQPHNAEDAWAVQREDGSWLLDGLIPIPELKDRLELGSAPEEDKGKYHTLGGMMMWLLGQVPRIGDRSEWEQWRFEVIDMDGRRVDKVLASRVAEQSNLHNNVDVT
ncbi:MAG: HlyC/CorC family transporter [Nitrospiraceae bacterium]|nr:HlyC/CorC family transporter [Nitrospiraceae bacterium]